MTPVTPYPRLSHSRTVIRGAARLRRRSDSLAKENAFPEIIGRAVSQQLHVPPRRFIRIVYCYSTPLGFMGLFRSRKEAESKAKEKERWRKSWRKVEWEQESSAEESVQQQPFLSRLRAHSSRLKRLRKEERFNAMLLPFSPRDCPAATEPSMSLPLAG